MYWTVCCPLEDESSHSQCSTRVHLHGNDKGCSNCQSRPNHSHEEIQTNAPCLTQSTSRVCSKPVTQQENMSRNTRHRRLHVTRKHTGAQEPGKDGGEKRKNWQSRREDNRIHRSKGMSCEENHLRSSDQRDLPLGCLHVLHRLGVLNGNWRGGHDSP